MLIDLIVGARPNFMKIAPVIAAIRKEQEAGTAIDFRLVHTGQHYDTAMSGSFFEQLDIPAPDVNFDAGGGTQAQQTAAIMIGYETFLTTKKPDLTLVVGDVTSTMACTIVAKKAGVKVAHVEAGIRSNDHLMPEEINRMVTDSITDYFFTTTPEAGALLERQAVSQDNIFFVGNVMIDTLKKQEPFFSPPSFWEDQELSQGSYFVLTLHRPSNVDDLAHLKALLSSIAKSTRDKKIVWPVHPRAASRIAQIVKDQSLYDRFVLVPPMDYRSFNYLVKHAFAVLTDSGGITEETTVMGVPCMTLRDSTERPETVSLGTNVLLGSQPEAIPPAMQELFDGHWKQGRIPALWDGAAATRIVKVLKTLFPN
ncbi:MAG: UDP-N-acetylglucosamine 2-epimerase (non-hydrolyzing) [Dokdonia sp.]|jgi:UDP-N-acetylglucosamine 2-epimerase (non-hydrolysing)